LLPIQLLITTYALPRRAAAAAAAKELEYFGVDAAHLLPILLTARQEHDPMIITQWKQAAHNRC
jgi:hypothetical protein